MNQTNTQGQRVQEPTTVTSPDEPTEGEGDAQRLKEDMRQAVAGSSKKLDDAEDQARSNAQVVRPDHKSNDAGQ
ncbi:hypothetical protein [Pseudorhodoferax sp. Leaf267]|uniref:hypothetical protein n=1 Tax=Pseudorhodoferax sp. Leaf267 TaxID=1736316 RepID=UPI00138F40D5|nr:hypothetical protein [Pseudorhodoferax sp. Leaf267]